VRMKLEMMSIRMEVINMAATMTEYSGWVAEV
jgi:hypothetical protein